MKFKNIFLVLVTSLLFAGCVTQTADLPQRTDNKTGFSQEQNQQIVEEAQKKINENRGKNTSETFVEQKEEKTIESRDVTVFDRGAFNRAINYKVIQDKETGVEYIVVIDSYKSDGESISITPRLNADGSIKKHKIKEVKNNEYNTF